MRTYKSIGYKTRQFEDLARIVGEAMRVHGFDNPALCLVMNKLETLFRSNNPQFSSDRFLDRVLEYAEGRRV